MPEQLSFAGFEPQLRSPPARQSQVGLSRWPDKLYLLTHLEGPTADATNALCRTLIRQHDLRVSPQANPHVTLHPLGDYADTPSFILDLFVEACGSIRHPPFEVVCERVTSWNGEKHHQPLVMLPSVGGNELVELHRAFRSAMAMVVQRPLPRWSCNPHVTLARARKIGEQPIAPIRWMVREFSLVRSIPTERRHDVIKSWLLRA
jgi:RNA 2',3'-cyclic 3'-phosphodiesterase